MKIKKFLLPLIFLVLTIAAYIAATVIFCYTTKPEVTKCDFPFSITYEYKGETKKLSGIYKCEFSGSHTILREHRRYWEGEAIYDNPDNVENPHIIDQNDELQTTLAIQENMFAPYFMGDPLYKDYYTEYGENGPAPYIEYYDYENDISLNDENRDGILESIGFKIVDYTYAKPIENSFFFSGFEYEADNIVIFNWILIVFLLLCLVFVRKDKEYQYSVLDKCGIVVNFVLGIFVLPFISVICTLFGTVTSNVELINQIIYSIPPFSILCLALSIVFRRKGFFKTGFFIQFGGVLLFMISVVVEAIV